MSWILSCTKSRIHTFQTVLGQTCLGPVPFQWQKHLALNLNYIKDRFKNFRSISLFFSYIIFLEKNFIHLNKSPKDLKNFIRMTWYQMDVFPLSLPNFNKGSYNISGSLRAVSRIKKYLSCQIQGGLTQLFFSSEEDKLHLIQFAFG